MKHKISNLLIVLGVLATLPACVEVKDKNEEGEVVIQTIQGEDLIVDEPLFLHEGEFISQDAFRQLNRSGELKEYQLEFANIKIGPKGVLYTMGHNVRIRAASLISESGELATFPSQWSNPVDAGKHGGHLQLDADGAQGDLKVAMRGSVGKAGAIWKDAGNGGDTGTLALTVQSPSAFRVSLDLVPGPSGVPSDHEMTGADMGGNRVRYKTSKPGLPGKTQTACISLQGSMLCQAVNFVYSK